MVSRGIRRRQALDTTPELSRALAKLDPDDEFELISPVPFLSSSFEQNPPNLRMVEATKRIQMRGCNAQSE